MSVLLSLAACILLSAAPFTALEHGPKVLGEFIVSDRAVRWSDKLGQRLFEHIEENGGPPSDTLKSGQALKPGVQLMSADGRWRPAIRPWLGDVPFGPSGRSIPYLDGLLCGAMVTWCSMTSATLNTGSLALDARGFPHTTGLLCRTIITLSFTTATQTLRGPRTRLRPIKLKGY